MGKKKKNKKNSFRRERRPGKFALSQETKQRIWGILMILVAILINLSFFGMAGIAGQVFMKIALFLLGKTIFCIPAILLILGVVVFFTAKYTFNILTGERKIFWPVILAICILILAITGILGTFNAPIKNGGLVGYFLSWPLLRYFGFLATQIIFSAAIIISLLIFLQFLRPARKILPSQMPGVIGTKTEAPPKSSIIRKIFAPKFKVKEISPFAIPELKSVEKQQVGSLKLETKPIEGTRISSYQPPPLDLIEKERGAPTSGDTRINSAVIKKTLQNFGIEVSMSEINIGPTVTQYTLKPAEGVKLSKITVLSNDLALALASHPIRIEAPIPGRSLVGIEVPNKIRAQVRLRNLIESPNFQKSPANLLIALGRDVSGIPVYADLARMPHLLVAGSTGSGKTIFLNTLILSLLYQPNNSTKSGGPEFLRFILVDPKRVEFPVYENLPHLLCPVIYNAIQTVNALRWLTEEMERRFGVLAETKTRDIGSFNEIAYKNDLEPLPFIMLIIDELADLMAARGKEIEVGIVRLAQMARAVGIHLVVATQRPSVEVITGLIKANITSRITFQVASQVDSRTVLDMAGAEKLLGSGDMLYISAETTKPKRIQAAYVSDKEVKRVIGHINSERERLAPKIEMNDDLIQELERGVENSESYPVSFYGENDPLYEEAKKVVIEAQKASASLLQRRLRIGYARAARLIDILEERGIVGPGEGAKPRKVFGELTRENNLPQSPESEAEDEGGWHKV